jgi:hypothetical protein
MQTPTEGNERSLRQHFGPVWQPSVRIEACRIRVLPGIVMQCVLAERDLGTRPNVHTAKVDVGTRPAHQNEQRILAQHFPDDPLGV